jgi:AcrR family transcriptional regulator
MLSYLCKIAGVSRSGFYNYFSSKSQIRRNTLEKKDAAVKKNILKAYNFK